MARLPNGDRAVVDRRKLSGYVLDPTHEEGKHKARTFSAALGLAAKDADVLEGLLKHAAVHSDAVELQSDTYGTRYAIESMMEHQGRSAYVRSAWIVRQGEDVPRLVSAWVAKKRSAT